jgi:hypothetical protein
VLGAARATSCRSSKKVPPTKRPTRLGGKGLGRRREHACRRARSGKKIGLWTRIRTQVDSGLRIIAVRWTRTRTTSHSSAPDLDA